MQNVCDIVPSNGFTDSYTKRDLNINYISGGSSAMNAEIFFPIPKHLKEILILKGNENDVNLALQTVKVNFSKTNGHKRLN
jgi:hypothetical protein